MLDAACGDTRRGGGPSIPPSAAVLAAVTVAAASSEANTHPPSSIGVDVTATTVTMAADIANDARYDPAVNVDGGPSPAALDNDADIRLPSLRGEALFGGPFSSWQVASSSTSLTSDADAAAPDVDVPPPFALSGASPSLHARHEEQRFLFVLESFEWLHRWHGHDEASRV